MGKLLITELSDPVYVLDGHQEEGEIENGMDM